MGESIRFPESRVPVRCDVIISRRQQSRCSPLRRAPSPSSPPLNPFSCVSTYSLARLSLPSNFRHGDHHLPLPLPSARPIHPAKVARHPSNHQRNPQRQSASPSPSTSHLRSKWDPSREYRGEAGVGRSGAESEDTGRWTFGEERTAETRSEVTAGTERDLSVDE